MIKYLWCYFFSLACFLWLYKTTSDNLKKFVKLDVLINFYSISSIHSESELYICHFMSSSHRRRIIPCGLSDQLQNMNHNYWIIEVSISQTALTLKLIYAKLFHNFLWITNSWERKKWCFFKIANQMQGCFKTEL